ncbi:unnamed protein product [Rhodiola kirilowii]
MVEIDEMIKLIMLKLPAKSLIRFKCVSKAWNNLISRHVFGHQWYKSCSSDLPRDNFMVIRNTDVQICFTRLSVSHLDGKLDKSLDTFRLAYISSGDPLIYPAGFGFYCLCLLRTKRLCLWNPTIRELKVVPWSPFNSKQKRDEYVYAFAHVQYNEGVFSYKVGLMRHRHKSSNIVVTIELYSSSERCWRLLKDCYILEHSSEIIYSAWPCKGTNLNGKFHFLDCFSKQDSCIVTFDMNTEKFGRLEIPSFIRHDSDCNVAYSVLTKFDENSLCLLLFRGLDGDHGGKTYIDVWIMKEYGITESWTKKGMTGPITNPDFVGVLGFSNSIEGIFFQSFDIGDGLLFCRYGSEKAEKFIPINSEDHETIQFAEHKEISIVSFNGTSDQRLTC